MTVYLLDTDVFIRSKNQHYGFDICPGFWNWIDREHALGRVFSIEKVYSELLLEKDELSIWVKQRKGMFLKPDQPTTSSLRLLSNWAENRGYRRSAVTDFMKKADLYLVAQAHATRHTVVTYGNLLRSPEERSRFRTPARRWMWTGWLHTRCCAWKGRSLIFHDFF
ncbi:MAG: DUF4411 family protein [Acidimicrobiia bacterium]|nr:DUF4411 family protein [Acidimicrobiia bacterium]